MASTYTLRLEDTAKLKHSLESAGVGRGEGVFSANQQSEVSRKERAPKRWTAGPSNNPDLESPLIKKGALPYPLTVSSTQIGQLFRREANCTYQHQWNFGHRDEKRTLGTAEQRPEPLGC